MTGSLFASVRAGDARAVERRLTRAGDVSGQAKLANARRLVGGAAPLHAAAESGRLEVMALLLDHGARPNIRNSLGQTPLMVACKYGRTACAGLLLDRGANVLLFDSAHGATCLHYAARGGHTDCMRLALEAGQDPAILATWGAVRFVNCRDSGGATPLHLAARYGQINAVRILLEAGALTTVSTARVGAGAGLGSLPLHSAARGGNVEVVRQLLAWGAERSVRDPERRTPYQIAVAHNHHACANLLDLDSAEPLVWPSPWKFMAKLDSQARELLETALAEANEARIQKQAAEKKAKEAMEMSARMGERERRRRRREFSSGRACLGRLARLVPVSSEGELAEGGGEEEEGKDEFQGSESKAGAEEAEEDSLECSICFERACDLQVEDCGHRMCATCTLALCCHCKPNQAAPAPPPPLCPFCRQEIIRLVAVPHCFETKVSSQKMNSSFSNNAWEEAIPSSPTFAAP